MGRAKGIMDYKSTPLMLTDKASSSSSTALVALQRTKTEVVPVTEVARVRKLNATAGLARGSIPEAINSLRHQIERSNAYLGMAALTDGVTGEGSGGGSGGGSGVPSDAVVVVKK